MLKRVNLSHIDYDEDRNRYVVKKDFKYLYDLLVGFFFTESGLLYYQTHVQYDEEEYDVC